DPLDDMTVWTVQEYAAPFSNPAIQVLQGSFGTIINRFSNPAPTLGNPNVTNFPIKVGHAQTSITVSGTGFYDFDPTNLPYATNHMSATISLNGAGTNGISNVVVHRNSATSATVTFDVSANATVGDRTITLTNPDGQVTNAGTIHVVQNVKPSLSGIGGGSLAYTENGAAIQIASNSLSVNDSDNTIMASATVKITTGFQGPVNGQSGQDVLSFTGSAQTGTIVANYNQLTGTLTLTATFQGGEAKSTWANALKSVFYQNTGDNPGNADRIITF